MKRKKQGKKKSNQYFEKKLKLFVCIWQSTKKGNSIHDSKNYFSLQKVINQFRFSHAK